MNNMKANKYLTFSYDDGVTQDIRLIELFNKYGMKGTFNLNSELLGTNGELVREGVIVGHNKNKPEDVKHIYEGHEVAAHTLTHPNLRMIENKSEIIRQVEQDRLNLSRLCGYEVVGMAYPGGGINYSDYTSEIIRNSTGIQYARTTVSTYNFNVQTNLYQFKPSVYHHSEMDEMFKLGEQFLKQQTDMPQIFYIWGHSYEFDIHDDWGRFEEFLQMMHGRKDICYCTNKEVLLL